MVYHSVAFFCTALLFLTLLEDRFQLWVTAAAEGAVFVLSLLVGMAAKHLAWGPGSARQLPMICCAALNYLAALVFFRDNPVQKLFVAMLAVAEFTFADLFLPLLLGALPFDVAGGLGGALSVLGCVLLTLLTILILYHPLHSFSDRGISGFLIGMCLWLAVIYVFCLGRLDFLFRGDVDAEKLLLVTLFYLLLFFSFRSVYQAGRFRAGAMETKALLDTIDLEQGHYRDLLSALKEVLRARRESEYTLDTVTTMLNGSDAEKAPEYVAAQKDAIRRAPLRTDFHPDPALNAIIALKALFAAQNGIAFSANAVTENTPLSMEEIRVLTDEILSRACADAARATGERRLRFTVFPAERSLRFEAVYSSPPMDKRRPRAEKSKNLSAVLKGLFEEREKDDGLSGLSVTREIISRYSGSLTLSQAGSESILQARLRF